MRKLYIMCIAVALTCLVATADEKGLNAFIETQGNAISQQVQDMKEQGLYDPELWEQLNLTGSLSRQPAGMLDVGGDTIGSCTIISTLPYQDYGNTCNFGDDYDEACEWGYSDAPDVVYCFTPDQDMCIDVSMCNDSTDYDTKLFVYEGSTANVIGCVDDACATASYPYPYVSEITGLQLYANTDYYIVIDGYGLDCGNYDLTVIEVSCPPLPAPRDCPTNTLYGQRPHWGGEPGGNALISDQRIGSPYGFHRLYEYFSDVNGPICDIHWWGLSIFIDYGWNNCDEDPMTFDITFHPDSLGTPGLPICSYTVTLNRQLTSETVYGFPVYYFETELNPCCNLTSGWVSIFATSTGYPLDCWFLWRTSPFGDGQCLAEDNVSIYPLNWDLSLCLTGEPAEEWDLGDLDTCNYPTLVCNPSHVLTDIAWLGPGITAEATPNQFDLDPMDDGVVYLMLPWMPCTMQSVVVTVTGGINYAMFEYMGGHLYLNGWKDGNLDFDFCDTLCIDPTGVGVDEWIVQDVMVWPGVFNFNFLDPGVLNMGHYDGVFRWRLTSQPIGRQGFGLIDNTHCPNMVCGTFAHDTVGEVEDYVIPYGQLPVELVSFKATSGDGRVTLNWSTASETDNDHFVLYRRVAGSTVFDRHAQIPGSGTTTTQRDYTYIDNAVVNGVSYEYQLADVDINGVETVHEMIVDVTPFAGAEVPTEYALHQNWPNPFNPMTTIRYDIKAEGQVYLKVFNLLGQEVITLVDKVMDAGSYTIKWDASGLPSGVYLYRMEANGFHQVKKLLFLK